MHLGALFLKNFLTRLKVLYLCLCLVFFCFLVFVISFFCVDCTKFVPFPSQSCLRFVGSFLIHTWMLRIKIMEVIPFCIKLRKLAFDLFQCLMVSERGDGRSHIGWGDYRSGVRSHIGWEGNEILFIRVWKPVLNTLRESSKRTTSTSGEFGRLQMVSKLDIE